MGLIFLGWLGSKHDMSFRIDFVCFTLEEPPCFGTENLGSFIYSKELFQYLPIGVLVEEKGIVKLHYENCLRFIDEKSRNNGFFGKFFS